VLLPAIVHLHDPDREDSGFAVLVGRASDAYHLDEGIVPEPHHLTRLEFERLWSGIVVTFERGAGAAPSRPRHAGLLWRVGRWFRGGDLAAPVTGLARVALAGCGLLASWPQFGSGS
jgi:hypothetical protein